MELERLYNPVNFVDGIEYANTDPADLSLGGIAAIVHDYAPNLDPERLSPVDALGSVAAYHGLAAETLLQDNQDPDLANIRLMAMHILIHECGIQRKLAFRMFGVVDARHGLEGLDQRLQHSSTLRRQRQEILEPKTAEREPMHTQIIKKVCTFYGVDPEAVSTRDPGTELVRPKQVIAYLLRENHGFTIREIARVMKRTRFAVTDALNGLQAEMDQNPIVAKEVGYISRVKKIRVPINERIVNLVSEATGVSVDEIMQAETPATQFARQIAMTLIAERGHLSHTKIVEYFGFSAYASVREAKIRILHQRANDPVTTQQVSWIRAHALSESPAKFELKQEDQPADLEENTILFLRKPLPEIGPDFVEPSIQADIIEIIEQVASYYGLEPNEIAGRSADSTARRARRAAIYLCATARIPVHEMAVCFDSRSNFVMNRYVQVSLEYAEVNDKFAEEIDSIRTNEPRRDAVHETLSVVADYYGISQKDIRSGSSDRITRARKIFIYKMFSEYGIWGRDEAAITLGMDAEAVRHIFDRVRVKMSNDRRLKAEVDYFMNPDENPKPPNIKDILHTVSRSYGIDVGQLLKPVSGIEVEARRTAIYHLYHEVSMCYRDIGSIFGISKPAVHHSMNSTNKILAESPEKIIEIESHKPPESINFSLATKVLHYVEQKYGIRGRHLTDLSDLSGRIVVARQVTASLLYHKAGMSVDSISRLFALPIDAIDQVVSQSAPDGFDGF